MAKPKFDGVVEAVHYGPEGRVDWVRTYLRRGPTFSDYILLDRQTLIEHLRAGKKYVAGKRIPQLASTFEVTSPIRLIQKDGEDLLVSGDIQADAEKDHLENVPVI
jgi:hypothetical protein